MTTQITTDNISPTTLEVLGSAVPKVSTIAYPGDDTAANPAGGDTITLTGTGFVAGATVIINGTSAGVVTVVSGTTLTFTAPASSPGTYVIYVINSDGGTAIVIPGISYSGLPNWSTSAGSLGNIYEVSNVNTTVVATGDVPITYSLYSGNLPAGSNINGSTGLISGTAPAAGSPTTYSFVIKATDNEQQDTNRSFSLTINPDTVAWINPANASVTTSYEYANISNVSLSANTESNTSVSFSQSGLPAGLSLTGNTISGSSNTVANTSVTLTATGNVAGRTATRTVYFNVQQDVVTWSSPANNTTYESFTNSAISNVSLSASSAGGQSITYTANTLPTGVSVSGSVISGTATDAANTTTLLTATSALSNRTATRTINWVISVANDPYFKNTTLLLNGETTNTPFISDSSTNSFGLTIQGDTKPVLFNPYRGDGYYSAYFDGTGDTLSISSPTTGLSFGTGEFTIECWVYKTVASNACLVDARSSAAATPWVVSIDASNFPYFYDGTSYTSSVAVTLNSWSHVSVVRTSGVLKIFVNGVQGYSASHGTNLDRTAGLVIGDTIHAVAPLLAYISNLRIVKGTAVYTSAFTPPTSPLTAIANTSLLTCQSNRFIDNSTNAFTITKNGDTTVSSAIPFTANSSYSTYGSAYFDGTGDYLSVPSSSTFDFDVNDFTIEFWMFPTASQPSYVGFIVQATDSDPSWFVQADVGGTKIRLTTWQANILVSNSNIPLNQWTHIAIVRNGGGSNNCKMYFNGVLDVQGTFTNDLGRTDSVIVGGGYLSGGRPKFIGYLSNMRVVNGTAVYTSAFTPPTTPLTAIANTSLLTLQYNGGANNSGIIDNSPFNNIITRAGNASQGTFSPYSVTGWSNYFDGTGDYLTVPTTSTQNQWWTENFTIEAWVYPTNLSTWLTNTNPCLIGNMEAGSSTNYWSFGPNTNGTVRFKYFNGGSVTVDSTETISLNQWSHIAFVKDSNGIRIYVNGVGTTSTAVSGTPQSSSGLTIGQHFNSSILGYVSNIRVVKGTALYTSTFTPSTTPLTAIANTSLLTCQSNRFIDNSPNSFTLTRNGDVSVQALDPFGSVPEATPISYSNYFDGTGDYLTGPANNSTTVNANTPFTIEVWAYFNNFTLTTQNPNLFTFPGGAAPVQLYSSTGGVIGFWDGTSNQVTGTVVQNTWNHIAVARNSSGSIAMWINGTRTSTNTGYTVAFGSSSGSFYIATFQGAGGYINGYISNLRIVNGTEVYATSQTTITVPTSPLTAIANTSLLTCQSTRMIDNSTNNFTLTANGDTKPRIFNPFGYTAQSATSYTPSLQGGSIYLDGTGDYLSTFAVNWSTFGSFTIEFWVYHTSMAAAGQAYLSTGSTNYTNFYNYSDGRIGVGIQGINEIATASGSIKANQWQYVTYTYDGTTTKIYVNGIMLASGTTAVYSNNSAALQIGNGLSTQPVFGYMSDVRITKGTPIYTSNFVPPAQALTNYSTTNPASLLLNFNNGGIIDQHGSNVIETLGNAQLSTAVKKYNNASMYFDGTGDYLYSPPNLNYAMGSGDFTIEFWYYPISQNPAWNPNVMGNYNATWTTNKWALHAPHSAAAGKYSFWVNNYVNNAPILASTSNITNGAWVYLAITRSGSTWRMFVNGTIEATTTSSVALDGGTAASMDGFYVGANFYSGEGGRYINAYIDDLRITKGYARYTANFTAPTSALITK